MAMPANTSKLVYGIEETREAVKQPPASRDWSNFTSSAIILDNGASTMRAGWAAEGGPRIVSENVVARYKDRKSNRNILLAGSEAYADATSRAAVKSPFEGDVLVNFDQMVRRDFAATEERVGLTFDGSFCRRECSTTSYTSSECLQRPSSIPS